MENDAIKSLAVLRSKNRKERRRIGREIGVKIVGTSIPIIKNKDAALSVVV